MKENVGSIDRIVRVLIAILASMMYFSGLVSGILGYIVLAVGGIMLLTSITGVCPIYKMFGMSTCKRRKQ
ncbi:YgaP family membrane protein [Sanyastnella coralliicola]|uniref:YgaP family membrane protein n=1 Tax=Sanyastnella coralliicola TaxID=3069118 RepID=UPI0027BA5C5B|nr:DUF2892 domain-containing protein [Longitalea sp. SCSIO 12813]